MRLWLGKEEGGEQYANQQFVIVKDVELLSEGRVLAKSGAVVRY